MSSVSTLIDMNENKIQKDLLHHLRNALDIPTTVPTLRVHDISSFTGYQ